jgi:MFS family permease
LIASNSEPTRRGQAFGVHRAFDTAGALAGPLVAVAVLAATLDSYDAVFVVSFSFALVGLAILILFVPADSTVDATPSAPAAPWSLRGPLLRTTIAAAVLGVTTISDAFLFLAYRQTDELDLRFFPLLFTGTALVYLILAVPVGRLSDHIGRRPVLLAGYVSLGAAYLSLVVPAGGGLAPVPMVVFLGAYYAATDGVLMAMVSDLVDPGRRATGFAVVTTATVAGRFISSVVFGAVWSVGGPTSAVSWFAAGLAVAVLVSWRLLPSTPNRTVAP